MWQLVALTGVFIVAVCLYFILRPQALADMVNKVFVAVRWIYMISFLRLMLGALLLASARDTGFPQTIAAFGWLFVLGSLALLVIPQPALQSLTQRMISFPHSVQRLWLIPGAALGGFMLYASLA